MGSKKDLINSSGIFRPEAIEKIKLHASDVECECPTYLLDILKAVNTFQEYQTTCLISDLKEREIHEWLLEKGHEVEVMISQVIIDLMIKEKFVDENFKFLKPPKI
jgi:hypothetical protein